MKILDMQQTPIGRRGYIRFVRDEDASTVDIHVYDIYKPKLGIKFKAELTASEYVWLNDPQCENYGTKLREAFENAFSLYIKNKE